MLRSPAGSADEGAGGAAVATLRKHTGPVKGLEFNASSPNLLASGSTDGDLIIWDVAQPSSPASYQLVRAVLVTMLRLSLAFPRHRGRAGGASRLARGAGLWNCRNCNPQPVITIPRRSHTFHTSPIIVLILD